MDITTLPDAALSEALDRAIDGDPQEWSVRAMLDEMRRRSAFDQAHGSIPGYFQHVHRGEEPCDECRAAFEAREVKREAQRETRNARRRETRSPNRRLRDENFAELHAHWLDVLDCERRGVRHVCPTCP